MLFSCCCFFNFENRKKPHRLLTFLSSAREQKIMVKEMERARLAAFGWCALELWGNCGASLLALSAVPPSESLPLRIKNDYFFNSLIERISYVQGFALDAGDENHSQFNRMIKSSARNSARRRMKEKLDWLFMDLRRFVSHITISCLVFGLFAGLREVLKETRKSFDFNFHQNELKRKHKDVALWCPILISLFQFLTIVNLKAVLWFCVRRKLPLHNFKFCS